MLQRGHRAQGYAGRAPAHVATVAPRGALLVRAQAINGGGRREQGSVPLTPVAATPGPLVPGPPGQTAPAVGSSSSGLLIPQRGSLIIPSAAAVSVPSSPAVVQTSTTSSYSVSDAPLFLPNGQRVHSLHQKGLDVINSLGHWAATDLARYLKPVDKSWQPTDFLPDSASPDFYDQVIELRKSAAQLPNDYLVVLVGDMVTEEALPSYMNMLNTLDGTKDETGAQDHPWAHWTRHWTAEENRHGDLLNKYLYLSGRVDMRQVEVSIQNLIGSGLDPQLENNPYLCFIYTSFQERATKISHGNTARLSALYGDSALTKICGFIAADEGRHETAYSAIVEQLFHRDPNGTMLAFADMMKKGIVMPAHFVDDGVHTQNNSGANLFIDYATVADNLGVYTTTDYANIVEHLVARWRIADITGLSGEAAEAQAYLVAHAGRIRRLAHIQAERRLRDRKRGKTREASFSWVGNRQVSLN